MTHLGKFAVAIAASVPLFPLAAAAAPPLAPAVTRPAPSAPEAPADDRAAPAPGATAGPPPAPVSVPRPAPAGGSARSEESYFASLSAAAGPGADPVLDKSMMTAMSRLMAVGRCGDAQALATRGGRAALAAAASRVCAGN